MLITAGVIFCLCTSGEEVQFKLMVNTICFRAADLNTGLRED